MVSVSQIIQKIGEAICIEVLNRPAEICGEPRNMVVFGSLVLIFTFVMFLAAAAIGWSDPSRR
jgi:hypothetical protein